MILSPKIYVICILFHLFMSLRLRSSCVWSFQKGSLEFGELEWIADMGLFGEQFPEEALAAAEVPQLPVSQQPNFTSYRPPKSNNPYKKPRNVMAEDDDEHFTVPDLGDFRHVPT